MIVVEKILFMMLSLVIFSLTKYCIDAFEIGESAFIGLALGGIQLFGVFIQKFAMPINRMNRFLGVFSLAALLLLLLAGSIGGSFHLSESNKVVAAGLFVISVIGMIFFLVRSTNEKYT